VLELGTRATTGTSLVEFARVEKRSIEIEGGEGQLLMFKRIDFLRATGLLAAVVMVGALAGCAGSMARKPGMMPELKLDPVPRSQYQILDTVEGKGEVTTILCFIKLGDKQFGYSNFGGGSAIGLAALRPSKDAAAAATYDAISKVANADVFMPLTTTASYSGFGCLYSKERAKVRGKGLRINPSR
jgi:hypothetical protein